MEINTGSGALPRNKGLSLARGEYIQFLDNDDTLTKTALEEMYTLAKEYAADVIYCERYFMSTGVGEEFMKSVHIADRLIQRPPFVDKPTFETKDLSERIAGIMNGKFWVTPWDKFVRRDVLVRHKIFFPPCKISDDDIWTYGLIFHVKKFLRVPNMVYIRRMRADSVTAIDRTPQQKMNFWLSPVLLGIKELDKLMSRLVFFKRNPQQRYAILKKFFDGKLHLAFTNAERLSSDKIYYAIKETFGKRLGKHGVLISALCTSLCNDKKEIQDIHKVINKFTARIDVKLEAEGDFQIFNMSNDKAMVVKPAWFQKDGVGYMITSYAGKLEFTTKTTVDGRINLVLRGLDVRRPEDYSKRIPYWIDYTKLVINDKAIFDKLTPTWHDKPYRYSMNVKSGEEIKIQIEWLPHRNDT